MGHAVGTRLVGRDWWRGKSEPVVWRFSAVARYPGLQRSEGKGAD